MSYASFKSRDEHPGVAKKEKVVKRPTERVYRDVFGTMKQQWFRKSKLFEGLLDEYNVFSMDRFFGKKKKAAGAVIDMINELDNLFKDRVDKLASIY